MVFGGLVLLLYWATLVPVEGVASALLFAFFAAIVEYVDIALPEGSSTSAVSAIGIAALLLLPLPLAVYSMVLGVTAARLFKAGRALFVEAAFFAAETSLIVSISGLVVLGATYAGSEGSTPALLSIDSLRVLLMCFTYFATEVALSQLDFSLKQGTKFSPLFRGAVKFLGPPYLALSSIGILMALMYPTIGVWSGALFLVLLLVTRQSFSLYLDIRKTYRSTIAALATAIEAEAPERRGHGERVASLAVKIAREMGIHGQELERIGYAALLHDIGKLGIDDDSFDGLMEQVRAESGDVQHAIAGADILGQVEFLRPAATMVRWHHRPVSTERKSRSTSIDSLGARIIGVASCFDDLTNAVRQDERLREDEAVGRLRKDQSLVFDSRVVRALGHVVEKSDAR
ncbi:MAG: HD domain-containing protein [Actinobacteria bacterium]|nr:MAG: HD domain-containing protein [Actinomycetota bacterium]